MTVRELIEKLREMPQDAEVKMPYPCGGGDEDSRCGSPDLDPDPTVHTWPQGDQVVWLA